jgi:hypothetical protein
MVVAKEEEESEEWGEDQRRCGETLTIYAWNDPMADCC